MVHMQIQSGARLNVLVTQDRPHAPEHWTAQLPRLLEPQGVAAYVVRTGSDAVALAESLELHAAVIDLATPIGSPQRGRAAGIRFASHRYAGGSTGEGGFWLLELFRRLPNRPPVVVVNNPSVSDAQLTRALNEALRLGAFSVLNKPVELEQLLRVFQRLIERRYRGTWPVTNRQPGSQPSAERDV